MYPIYTYQDNIELPSEGQYFVVAGNGIFLRKDNGLFSGFVPVKEISFLDDFVVENSKLNLPKIPYSIVQLVKTFFSTVFEKYHAEACVVIFYHEEQRIFKVVVPEQQVSSVAVTYRRPLSSCMPGFKPVGTIHSHCNFNAFHSSVDDADENNFDGLHITFGHINSDQISCSASIVLNGLRTKIEPTSILEGLESIYSDRYIVSPLPLNCTSDLNSWMEKVNRR